jgi:hypothetical protein
MTADRFEVFVVGSVEATAEAEAGLTATLASRQGLAPEVVTKALAARNLRAGQGLDRDQAEALARQLQALGAVTAIRRAPPPPPPPPRPAEGPRPGSAPAVLPTLAGPPPLTDVDTQISKHLRPASGATVRIRTPFGSPPADRSLTPLPATTTPLPAPITPRPAPITPPPALLTPAPATTTPPPASLAPSPAGGRRLTPLGKPGAGRSLTPLASTAELRLQTPLGSLAAVRGGTAARSDGFGPPPISAVAPVPAAAAPPPAGPRPTRSAGDPFAALGAEEEVRLELDRGVLAAPASAAGPRKTSGLQLAVEGGAASAGAQARCPIHGLSYDRRRASACPRCQQAGGTAARRSDPRPGQLRFGGFRDSPVRRAFVGLCLALFIGFVPAAFHALRPGAAEVKRLRAEQEELSGKIGTEETLRRFDEIEALVPDRRLRAMRNTLLLWVVVSGAAFAGWYRVT